MYIKILKSLQQYCSMRSYRSNIHRIAQSFCIVLQHGRTAEKKPFFYFFRETREKLMIGRKSKELSPLLLLLLLHWL